MAKISFKAKIQTVYKVDDTVAYHCIKVPGIDSVALRYGCFTPTS